MIAKKAFDYGHQSREIFKDYNKKEVMPCMEKTNQTKELFLIEYDCNKLKIWNPWTGFQHQPISPSKILLEFETTAILTLSPEW